jgi:hypothetical protein
VKAASAHDVCGVIVSSPMHFERFPGLAEALIGEGFSPRRFGSHLVLYERTPGNCPFRG